MNIPQVNRQARSRGLRRTRRIRFRDAVPLRRDRRDLRRLLRRAARAVRSERQAEMSALLQRLAAARVPLSAVVPGPPGAGGVVVFGDGTRLLLVTGRGDPGLRWLSEGHRAAGAPVWLVRAQPSFASGRFRLWFAAPGSARPAELLARVGPVAG